MTPNDYCDYDRPHLEWLWHRERMRRRLRRLLLLAFFCIPIELWILVRIFG